MALSLKLPEGGFYLKERENRRSALNPGNNPTGEEGRKRLLMEVGKVRIQLASRPEDIVQDRAVAQLFVYKREFQSKNTQNQWSV